MSEPIVIVGGGQAAAKAVDTLRSAGYDRDIVVLGDEAYAPYQRPPLSKKYLAGEIAASALLLRPEQFYLKHAIDLRTGARVGAIDVAGRRVMLLDGESLPYRKLLLATGAAARSFPLPGSDLDGVVMLRSIADVDAIRERLKNVGRAVVIGGGYIGLEVAAVLCMRGVEVTVLEGRERVMARVVSEGVSRFFEAMHREHGVDLRLGVSIARIVGSGAVSGVELADGSVAAADIVLVAVGCTPNDELAAAAGLSVRDGIVVDGSCRTAAPDVFAAGDCARFWSNRYGREIRLECVQNAIDQAKAAALAMLGDEQAYDPVPWFWSDQYETKLQIVGLTEGYDRIVTEPGASPGSFAVSYFRGETLLAVDAINATRSYVAGKRALSGESPGRAAASAVG